MNKKGPPFPNENDLKIMKALSENPTAKDSQIGHIVNLSASQVGGRLQKLRAAGYVQEVTRRADLALTDSMVRYRIDIKINPRDLQKSKREGLLQPLSAEHPSANAQQLLAYLIRDVISKRYSSLIVEEISILLGDPADLCATVLVPDQKTIFKFVIEELRSLEEIENTSTSNVAWRITGNQ